MGKKIVALTAALQRDAHIANKAFSQVAQPVG
jgi:hypothetical protein